MRTLAVALGLLLVSTACPALPEPAATPCSGGDACMSAPLHAARQLDAIPEQPLKIVRIPGSLAGAAKAYALSFDEALALQRAPLLSEHLLRSDEQYMFTFDTERLQLEVPGPGLTSPTGALFYGKFRTGTSGRDAFPVRATRLMEFGNVAADDNLIRPSGRVGLASGSPHAKLRPAHVELLSRMRHIELATQFEATRHPVRRTEVLPQFSVALPLVLGLFVVMMRRTPLRSRPSGLWLGAHP